MTSESIASNPDRSSVYLLKNGFQWPFAHGTSCVSCGSRCSVREEGVREGINSKLTNS